MVRLIFNFLVGSPGRLTALGSFIGHVGCFFLLAGVFGAIPGLLESAFTHEDIRSLSSLFPQLPLWWIPESGLAFFAAFVTTVAGAYIWEVGRRIDTLYQVPNT